MTNCRRRSVSTRVISNETLAEKLGDVEDGYSETVSIEKADLLISLKKV